MVFNEELMACETKSTCEEFADDSKDEKTLQLAIEYLKSRMCLLEES